MSRGLLLGTRSSELARLQAQAVEDALAEAHPSVSVDRRIIESQADLDRERAIVDFGGTGAFTKTLDKAVLNGTVDLAVHSLKDVPTDRPDAYRLGAVLPRGPAGDVLVADDPLDDLPEGATVGTGSMRRRALLARIRPDLEVTGIRGNVPTRVGKWRDGDLDAIVLAEAGLHRLGLEPPTHELDPRRFPPAPGQGAIAAVAREDTDALDLLAAVDHEPSRIETSFERRVLSTLGGGCLAPLGCRARVADGLVEAWVRLLSPDGGTLLEEEVEAPLHAWGETADTLAEALRSQGGQAIVDRARELQER